jgi:hypothetical protein
MFGLLRQLSFFLLLALYFTKVGGETGLLFQVSSGGSHLNIRSTLPHFYENAGIRLTTPGYQITSGCTPHSNGFCLFPVSDTQLKVIGVSGESGLLRFELCLNALEPISCQLYTLQLGGGLLGHFEFRENNIAIASLDLAQGDSGAITLFNSGATTITNINAAIPSAFSAYFISSCSGDLSSGSGCAITYSIPDAPTTGTHSIIATGNNADNSPLELPVTVSVFRGAKCWGRNNKGQLGDGSTTDRLTPINVSGLSSGVLSMASGQEHTCALIDTGGVKMEMGSLVMAQRPIVQHL